MSAFALQTLSELSACRRRLLRCGGTERFWCGWRCGSRDGKLLRNLRFASSAKLRWFGRRQDRGGADAFNRIGPWYREFQENFPERPGEQTTKRAKRAKEKHFLHRRR